MNSNLPKWQKYIFGCPEERCEREIKHTNDRLAMGWSGCPELKCMRLAERWVPGKMTHCVHVVLPGTQRYFREVRFQILIWFQTFFSTSQNPIFRLLMQFECIEKHNFSGISDYFRLFFFFFFYRCSHTHDIYGFDEDMTIIFVFIQNCLYKRHV